MHFNEPLLQSIMYALLAVTVCVCAAIDLREQRIPNKITFPAMAIFLILHAVEGGLQGFLFSLAGLGAGFSVLMAAYLMRLMGAGDVKLMAVIGACLGVAPLLTVFLLTSIAGGAHFVLIILVQRFRATSSQTDAQAGEVRKVSAGMRMSYGLAIALGTLGTLAMHYLGLDYVRFF